MDLEWLQKCQENHEEFFKKNNTKLKTIQGESTDPELREKWTTEILEWCNHCKEAILVDKPESLNPEGKVEVTEEHLKEIEELPIKLKYKSRNQYVIIDSYSFEELVRLTYDAFPEVREKDIEGFTWKMEKGNITGTIYEDSDLEFAVESMIAWERPVIRLEVVCIENEGKDDGAIIIPDEEKDLCHRESHC
jgi:hypothetical protein